MSNSKLSFKEKLELYRKEKFPLVERSELISAIREIPNLGPFDFNLVGMPMFYKSYAILFLLGLFLAPLAVVNLLYMNGQFYVPLDILGRVNMLGFVAVFAAVFTFMWMIISMNKGAFGYRKVIDYVWCYLDGREPRKGEFRVNRFWQIWPVSDTELEKWIEEAEKYEATIREHLADGPQLMALPGITPSLEEELVKKGFETVAQVANSSIESLKKVKGVDDDLASILVGSARAIIKNGKEDDEEVDLSISSLAVPSTSSLHRISSLMQELPGLKSMPLMKDDIREGLDLRHEFIRLVRKLHTEMGDDVVYTIAECAGDLNILIISRYPLTGGEEMKVEAKNRVELRDHTWKQRTYAWQDWNSKATFAVFTQLAEFKFYSIPEQKARAMGKEATVMHCPIAFLNCSDGTVEDDARDFRRARLEFKGAETIRAETVYNVSIAEQFLERDKILTSTLARIKKSIKDIWREAQDWAKNTIAQAVNMVLLERRYRQPGVWGGIVNLFSHRAVKYVLYGIVIICVYLVVAQLLGLPFGDVLDGGAGGGGGNGGPEVIP